MKINEVTTRRKTTGLEDLYKSSPEAKLFLETFVKRHYVPVMESHVRNTLFIAEHFNPVSKGGKLLLEYKDGQDQELELHGKTAEEEAQEKAKASLNAIAKTAKTDKGFNLDKVVGYLKQDGVSLDVIKAALDAAKLTISDVSFSGKGGDPKAANTDASIKNFASQIAKLKKDNQGLKAVQTAKAMVAWAEDFNDPELMKKVRAVVKQFKLEDKEMNNKMTKMKRDSENKAKQDAHFKAGQKADKEAQSKLKAELLAKRGKAAEAMYRAFGNILKEALRKNKQRMLKESKLMERDITVDQLRAIVRTAYNVGGQGAIGSGAEQASNVKADPESAKNALNNLSGEAKQQIKKTNQERNEEFKNLANSSESYKFAQSLKDANKRKAAEDALEKMAKEAAQESPESKNAVAKILDHVKRNKGTYALAAGVAALTAFHAMTDPTKLARMGLGAAVGGGGKALFSGIAGAAKGWKGTQGNIFKKIGGALKGGGKNIWDEKQKILQGALAGAGLAGIFGAFETAMSDAPAGGEVDLPGEPTGDAASRDYTGQSFGQEGGEYDMGKIDTTGQEMGDGSEFADPNAMTSSMADYSVQSGDTLGDIAVQNKTTVQAIVDANPDITNPDMIQPGQELKIPQNTIETGDSIWQDFEGGKSDVPSGQENLTAGSEAPAAPEPPAQNASSADMKQAADSAKETVMNNGGMEGFRNLVDSGSTNLFDQTKQALELTGGSQKDAAISQLLAMSKAEASQLPPDFVDIIGKLAEKGRSTSSIVDTATNGMLNMWQKAGISFEGSVEQEEMKQITRMIMRKVVPNILQ